MWLSIGKDTVLWDKAMGCRMSLVYEIEHVQELPLENLDSWVWREDLTRLAALLRDFEGVVAVPLSSSRRNVMQLCMLNLKEVCYIAAVLQRLESTPNARWVASELSGQSAVWPRRRRHS